MYTGNLDTSGMIRNLRLIAVIESRILKQTVHMVQNLGRQENENKLQLFNFLEVKTDNGPGEGRAQSLAR
jgi:hypothetical protein